MDDFTRSYLESKKKYEGAQTPETSAKTSADSFTASYLAARDAAGGSSKTTTQQQNSSAAKSGAASASSANKDPVQAYYDELQAEENYLKSSQTGGNQQSQMWWVPKAAREAAAEEDRQQRERFGIPESAPAAYGATSAGQQRTYEIAQEKSAIEQGLYGKRVDTERERLRKAGLEDVYEQMRKAAEYEDWEQQRNAYRGGGLGELELPESLKGYTPGESSAALKRQLEKAGIDADLLREYDRRAARAPEVEQFTEQIRREVQEGSAAANAAQSLGTVALSPLQGLDLLAFTTGRGSTRDLSTYVPVDPNAFIVTNIVNTVRGGVSKKIEESTDWELFGQNVASFAYNTGLSIADSALNVATFGPAASYVMGMTAAANGARETIERGGSNEQAFLSGLAQGTMEALFEDVSIENLLAPRTVTGWKQLITETLKQAGIEASEEFNTEIANLFFDSMILGGMSDREARIQAQMRDNHLTREEATKQVLMEDVKNVAWAAAGGAVSGGVMGGFTNTLNFRNYSGTARQYGKDFRGMGSEVMEAILQEGRDSGEDTDSRKLAERLTARLNNGKKITDTQLGRQYLANVDAINAENAAEALASPAAERTGAASGSDSIEQRAAQGPREAWKTETARALDRYADEAGMGSNGKETLIDFMPDSLEDSVSYFGDFSAYYRAGRSGADIDSVRLESSGRISPYAREAAYAAGQMDGGVEARRSRAAQTQEQAQAQTETKAPETAAPAVAEQSESTAQASEGEYKFHVEQREDGSYTVRLRNEATGENMQVGTFADEATAQQAADEYRETALAQQRAQGYTESTESKEGNENAERRESGSARQDGTSDLAAEERGRGVRGRTEETVRGAAARRSAAESLRNSVEAEVREVSSTRELGLESGTDTKAVRIVPESLYTDEMRSEAAKQAKEGRTVRYFTGELEISEDGRTSTARAAVSADGKTLYICADDAQASVPQLIRHEEFHAQVMADPDLMERVRQRILRLYSETELRSLVDAYVDAYGWGDLSEDYILEEIYADAYAGIDVFDYLSTYEGATRFTEAVEAAAAEPGTARAESQTAGETRYASKYVYPQLNATEWDLAKRLVQSNAGKDYNSGARYALKSEKGNTVFVIYSTSEDGTMLFAIGGDKAILANAFTESWMNGDEISYDGIARDIDKILEVSGRSVLDRNGNDSEPGNRGGADGASSVYPGESGAQAKRGGNRREGFRNSEYAALKNTLKNLDEGEQKPRFSAKRASDLYRTGRDFTEPVTTDEFRKAIKEENDPKQYFPKGLSKEFVEAISNKALFARPKLYRGIDYNEFEYLIEHGYLKSNGSYNLEHQQGQTFTDEDAGYALSYATQFAPDKIRKMHYEDGLPSFLIEFVNNPNLGMTKNEVQESYTTGKIDKKYITRIFEIDYDSESKKDMVSDLTDLYRADIPGIGDGLSELSHGLPQFYRDKTTGTILYAVQGPDGVENGRYISEAYPDIIFSYDQLADGSFNADFATKHWKISGNESVLEPMVIDSNGKLVPAKTDVRLSRDAETELRRQNEQLQQRVDYLRGQMRRTTQPTLRQGDVDRLASDLIRSYGSTLQRGDISDRLKALGEYILRGGEDLRYTDAKAQAVAIARDLVDNAEALSAGSDAELYAEVKAKLREPMKIDSRYARDISPDAWGKWRTANQGKVNVSINGKGIPVDTAYQELSEAYPWLFPSYVTNPADQVLQMVEAIGSLEPIMENPYSHYMAEAIEYCANDILDALIGEDVRQTPPTFADRAEAKLAAQKAADREKLDALRARKNAQIKDERQRSAWNTAQLIAQERAKRDQKIADLKAHHAEVQKRRAEQKADSAARARLLHIMQRLQNRKLPAVQRALLDQYIGNLDTIAVGLTEKSITRLADLRDWYMEQKENDPDFISDPVTEKKLERLSKMQVKDLTSIQVAELTEVLLNIENEIRTAKKLIDSEDRRDIYAQGLEVIEDVGNSRGSEGGVVDTMLTTEILSPMREARRITGYVDGDPLYRAARELENGQRRMFDYQMRAEKRFTEFVQDKDFIRHIAGKDAEEIRISGIGENGPETVTITPAMRMSLYLHSLNDQNLRHIAGGGISVPEMGRYRKGQIAEAYERGRKIKLTPSQVREIVSRMSAKEKAFALAAHAYFNGMSQSEINAVSEKLRGYSLALVENYFPINTDTRFTKSDFESVKFDGTVEGMGFLKERIDASNPIYLRDMNEVLSQSIRNTAKYVGLAIPIRNFNKIWGVTKASFNEDGSRNSYQSSVQQAIAQKWGGNATGYIEKLMADLQSVTKSPDKWAKLASKLRSNYARAVLELNASVAFKQAASYPTAAAVVGWGPLMRALADTRKVDVNLIAKYTPLLWYRSQGYSSQELGDIAKSGKSLPKVLNWIQGIDVATTTKLWKAAEYYVRENNAGLSRGSEEYYNAVAEVYNRIIEETQPNYTAMQRPQLLRSDNELVRTLNMFKTQPFQNFNILYDALGNLDAKRRAYLSSGTEEARTAYADARKGAARAISSQFVSAFVFALMQCGWDMFIGRRKKYEDKDGDITLLSWLKGMGFNMATSGLGMLPFGTEALELGETLVDKILKMLDRDPFFDAKWYGVDVSVVKTVNDTASAAMNAVLKSVGMILNAANSEKTVTGADWESYARSMYSSFTSFAQLLGMPIDNVRKLGTGIATNILRASEGKYVGGYDALRVTSDPSKYSSDYYDLLYSAYEHDENAYQEVYQKMLDSGFFTADKIKNAMEDRMKKAQGVSSVSDLDGRYLPPSAQEKYDTTLASVKSSRIWSTATDEQRDKAEDMLYQIFADGKAGDATREKIAGGNSVGLSTSEYILMRLALLQTDQPNANGKMGTYTNDEVEAAIRMVPGLSDAERSYLWGAEGKNSKTDPWK